VELIVRLAYISSENSRSSEARMLTIRVPGLLQLAEYIHEMY